MPFGSQGSAAQVVSVTGQVGTFRDGFPWALKVGDSLSPRQEVSSGPDGHAIFSLPDGSTWELFANSRATFRASTGGVTDLLDLWIGRVKVHIQKLGGRPNPNRVTTPTAVISVRGTIFDVTVEEEDVTLVLVEEGQVAVQHALLPYGEPRLLNPGDYLRVYKNDPLVKNRFDKGAIGQRVFNALMDMFLYRPRGVPGAGGSPLPGGGPTGGPSLPGDSGGGPTPPPPPPPPPPM
ncbi:MAG: FecR family protein [Bryobacteraceae bacterium]|nr:FecR family protein [Bryobacteraceae bacterium]